MAHKCAHRHSHNAVKELKVLGAPFVWGPLANTLTALSTMILGTHVLLRLCPPLSPSALSLMISFAFGCIVGNVFLHLVPEAASSLSSREFGLALIGSLIFFIVVHWLLFNSSGHSHSFEHVHSHSHSHSHNHDDAFGVEEVVAGAAAAKSVEKPEHLRRRGKQSDSESKERHHETPQTCQYQNLGWLIGRLPPTLLANVAADFLHNVADGISLMDAFKTSPSAGGLAVVLMSCHEIPHQIADYVVLTQTGAPRGYGLSAQLVAMSGTIVGALITQRDVLGATANDSERVSDFIPAITAGAFLYVAMAGILPEVLEAPDIHPRSIPLHRMRQLFSTMLGVLLVLAIE